MRITAALTIAVTAVALASCEDPVQPRKGGDGGDRPGAPTAAASAYAASSDVSGYYMPLDPVRSGKWSLDHVFLGQATEFANWRAGDRNATFAPVMLQFEDATSPVVQTEIGEARSVTARVLPTRFTVNDAQVRFEGRSAELGTVIFDGRLDQGALATARRNLGDEGVVLTGSLKIGDGRPQAVRLRWWMGD